MKSKKGKFILGFLALSGLVFLVLAVVAIHFLPSASDLRRMVTKPPPEEDTIIAPSAISEASPIAPESKPSEIPEKQPDSASNSKPGQENQNIGIEEELILNELMDSRKPLSNLCQHLAYIDQKQNTSLSVTEFGDRFIFSIKEESHDPLMAGFNSFFRFVFTRPLFKELFQEIKNADLIENEGSSLMNKASFYAKAFSAYQDLVSQKAQMEQIVDQSYLLMMIGRALEVKPDLRNDSRVQTYCEEIESTINTRQFPDFEKSKESFLDFLNKTQIDPKDIGFDLKYKTRLQGNIGPQGLHFTGGWLDDVFQKSQPPN